MRIGASAPWLESLLVWRQPGVPRGTAGRAEWGGEGFWVGAKMGRRSREHVASELVARNRVVERVLGGQRVFRAPLHSLSEILFLLE